MSYVRLKCMHGQYILYSLRVYSEATRQALSTVALAVAFSTRVIQLPHIQHQVRACYLVRTTYYVVRTLTKPKAFVKQSLSSRNKQSQVFIYSICFQWSSEAFEGL